MPTQRVNITLPEDLAARLEPYRNILNLSAICTETLKEVVSAFELRKQQAGGDLPKVLFAGNEEIDYLLKDLDHQLETYEMEIARLRRNIRNAKWNRIEECHVPDVQVQRMIGKISALLPKEL